jgi:two-component system NtrC family sensor kinase
VLTCVAVKLRVASIAFLLASISSGLTWLTLQPLLLRSFQALAHEPSGAPAWVRSARALLPWHLALDVGLLTFVAYLVLYLMVVRPLGHAEDAVGQLTSLDLELPVHSGGPLLSRFQASLRQLARAFQREQAVTREQLAKLSRANDELRRTQMELVSAERLATVGKLAAGVAHEVGNPLSGVLGYLSLARDRAKGDEAQLDYLTRIEAEVTRVGQIVRGLLDLGRPARGVAGPVVVAQLADTCVKLVQADPELRRVELSADVAPDAVVRSEPGPLSQILINLLLNAAQANGGKGNVRLSATREGEKVRIAVDDEGPGLSDEVRARLFEPFFTTKGGQGNGLGLAMSRHLAQSLGGTLSAENREGGGARFKLELPSA